MCNTSKTQQTIGIILTYVVLDIFNNKIQHLHVNTSTCIRKEKNTS